jgi:hypothetical protein
MADVKISQLPAGTADAAAVVPATNAAGTTTEKITLGDIAALAADQSLDTTSNVTFNSVTLPNYTQVVVGSFDNSTGGANGLSLICAVGYELNWQGGRLKNVYGGQTQTIFIDSPIEFTGEDGNIKITGDGIIFPDGTQTVAWTGAFSYEDLDDLPTLFDGSYASLSNVPSTFAPADGSVTDAKIDAAGLSASSINWTGVAAWAANTAYAKGALVHYLGITYRRSVAGTTGATFNAANWQQMTAPVNVTTTPAQLTGNANDYALAVATNDIFRISSDAARHITGISAGLFDGHAILLRNVGAFAITLKHQDAASAAANRLISPWAGDVVMSANSSMLLMYDSTLSRWVVT